MRPKFAGSDLEALHVTVLESAVPDLEAVHEAAQATVYVVVAAVAQLPGLQHVAGLVRHAEEEEPVLPYGVEEVRPEVGVLRRELEEVRLHAVEVLPPEVEVLHGEVVREVRGQRVEPGLLHDVAVLVQMLVLQMLV